MIVETELGKTTVFTEKEVDAKKRKALLLQKRERQGRRYIVGKNEMELDLEAAEAACLAFYENFKGHPSLGPGTVEDSVAVTSPIAGEDDIATHETEAEFASNDDTPGCSMRDSTVCLDSDEEDGLEDSEENSEEVSPLAKKIKLTKEPLSARKPKQRKNPLQVRCFFHNLPTFNSQHKNR